MGNKSLDDLISFPWASPSAEPGNGSVDETAAFARLLVSGTLEHIAEIDELIRKHLDSWDFDRVNKVDLAVLRMSVYPLKYQDDVHPTIIINEAIDISKEFGPGDTFKFVNAVLDNIRKEIGR